CCPAARHLSGSAGAGDEAFGAHGASGADAPGYGRSPPAAAKTVAGIRTGQRAAPPATGWPPATTQGSPPPARPRRGLVFYCREEAKNYVTSRHSLMPLGLTARNSARNYVTLVTALSRLDLRQIESDSSSRCGSRLETCLTPR